MSEATQPTKEPEWKIEAKWTDSGKSVGVAVRVDGRVLHSGTLRPFNTKGVAVFLTTIRSRYAEMMPGELTEGPKHRLREKLETLLADGPGLRSTLGPQYAWTDTGMVLRTADGPKPLCNYNARIIATRTIIGGDDDVRTVFEIVAWWGHQNLGDTPRKKQVRVDAGSFKNLDWVIEQLGAGAIAFPSNGAREHTVSAIQMLSDDSRKDTTAYAHTGWRWFDDKPHFLTAAGALGADGLRTDLVVELPEKLQRIRLGEPPTGDELRSAIIASLQCLSIAPLQVTLPMLCATYRAPLGENGQSMPVTGTTGTFKTSTVVVFLQHLGADHDAGKLPNWSSTSGANEALLYLAKDCLQVLDDFVPGDEGSRKLHQKGARLVRAGANQAGRDRLDRTSRLQAASYYPRCFTVFTGEESLLGSSIAARTWEVLMAKGAVRIKRLSIAQRAGSSGQLAQAMSGYIKWLATDGRIDQIDHKTERNAILLELRSETILKDANGIHARGPMNLADMLLGWRYFLNYAADMEVLPAQAIASMWRRGRDTLVAQLIGQSSRQVATTAAEIFMRILPQMIRSGNAHLTLRNGKKPSDPAKFGYRDTGTSGGAAFWSPTQNCIGFVDEVAEEVFLLPEITFREVQRVARDMNAKIEFQLDTVRDQLLERGALITEDRGDGKERPLTRVRLEGGKRPSMMRMKLSTFFDGVNDDPDDAEFRV